MAFKFPVYGKVNERPGFRLMDGSDINTLFSRVFQGGLSRQDLITAHSGGTQAPAFVLTKSLNNVTTVAADNDSVTLPKAIAGSRVDILNNGAHILGVYAMIGSGDTINGTAGTTQFSQAAAKRVVFTCVTMGKWLTSTAAIP